MGHIRVADTLVPDSPRLALGILYYQVKRGFVKLHVMADTQTMKMVAL